MGVFDRFLGKKALSKMQFPGRQLVWFDFPRKDENDMAREIGDGTTSDIVMTPVRWLQRAFNESQIAVRVDDELITEHPLIQLIENPNPFYAGEQLYAGTIYSLSTDGNAYWVKVRSGRGEVGELWWIPHQLMEPKWTDGSTDFISHYEYCVQGNRVRLEVSDVVHFRDGVDPQNMRKGLSPLRGLLREIWSDNEAAMFTASLMMNGGVPGLVLSPKNDADSITPEQAEQAREKIDSGYTRERRGKTIVMTGPTDLNQFGFNPQELDMSALRDVSEERVTAALGVPAAVVGFGAGLQQTKVGATMRELRQLAWHNGVIPLQRIVTGQINRALLADFDDKGKVEYDNSDVEALSEDETKHVERVTKLVTAGIWTRGEGREETGREAGPEDDVYLLPISFMEVRRGAAPPVVEPEPPKSYEKALQEEKHQHTLLEEQISESRRRASPTPQIEKFATGLDRLRARLPDAMEPELLAFFADLGAEAERVALDVLEETRSAGTPEMKRGPLDGERIAEGMEFLKFENLLKTVFEQHYLRVAGEIGKHVAGFLGVGVGMPDPVARAIIATGGRRAGLLDLTAKTRKAIMRRLVEGRLEGLAGENLARFIREGVEAGPWSTPKVRARVIARTETAFATNVSVIEGARSIANVEQAMIHDARAGSTDEVCEALNGSVVTLDQALQLAEDEHPNGTRSFTPLTPQLIEEMGL